MTSQANCAISSTSGGTRQGTLFPISSMSSRMRPKPWSRKSMLKSDFPDIPDFLRRPKDNRMPTPAFKPIVYSYTLLKTGITKLGKPTGFFDKDVWLRCKIDVTMLNGTAVFLSDFKTGNSKYEDPFELEIQALTLKAAIPAITKIAGHFAWLKENRIGAVHDLSD